jgi:TRAP-type C4-dicarboxylate transport system substrate-binding protein
MQMPLGDRRIISRKPVNTLADMKGLRIRETGPQAELYKAVGANPVALSTTDTYDAMSKGTLDAYSGSIQSFVSYGLFEIGKYYTDSVIGSPGNIWAMNLDSWKKLPADIQKIIQDVSIEYIEYAAVTGVKADAEYLDTMKKSGVNFIKFPAADQEKFSAAAQFLTDKWIKETEAAKLPGQQAHNLWYEAIQKYSKMYLSSVAK